MHGGTQNATLIKNQIYIKISYINQESKVQWYTKTLLIIRYIYIYIYIYIDQDQKGITVCRNITINMSYPEYNIQLELKHYS